MSGDLLPIPVVDNTTSGWWPLEEPLIGRDSRESPIYTYLLHVAICARHIPFGGDAEEACNNRDEAATTPPIIISSNNGVTSALTSNFSGAWVF